MTHGVDVDNFYFHYVAEGEYVAHRGNTLIGELRYVHKAALVYSEVDECSEGSDVVYLAVEEHACSASLRMC